MKVFRWLRFWLHNARMVALPQSLFPAILAIRIAFNNDDFSWKYAILAVIGVIFAHLSVNLFDDFFDYKNQKNQPREVWATSGLKVRVAKCDYLISGKATLKQLLHVAIFFGLIAIILGLWLTLARGLPILFIALLSGFLGFFYSANPLRLAYRGLGEIIVSILFGPLLMSGIYFATTTHWQPQLLLSFVPIGILAGNILFTHSIMDIHPDEKVLKLTLARWLKTPRKMLMVSAIFIFSPFLIIIIGIILKMLQPSLLLVNLLLPLAIMLFYLLYQFIYFPNKNFKPHWWMQPMERWKSIKSIGIDWFMIRWYLARNLMIYFSLFLFIALFL